MSESILNNKRVLAVDDEPDVLETLEEQLADFEGLIFDKALDYETGYHLLRSWSYDLVILDIMGVRGFDLLNAAVSSSLTPGSRTNTRSELLGICGLRTRD